MEKINLFYLGVVTTSLSLVSLSCANNRLYENPENTILSQESFQKMGTLIGNGEFYYYTSGGKQTLKGPVEKEFVLFREKPSESQDFNGFEYVVEPKEVSITSITPENENLSYEDEYWAIIKKTDLSSSPGSIIYRAPVFIADDGKEIALSHLFYVRAKNENDLIKIKGLEGLYNVKLLGRNKFMPLWFTFQCTPDSKFNALEISNKIFETGDFQEVYPDLIDIESDALSSCVNDPFFVKQWHLDSSGFGLNLCGTRSVTIGKSSVVVAVLDMGVELTHPDINIYTRSYDTETGTSPSLMYGSHGTQCAGLISAKTNNNEGIAALAPDCPVMSISNTLAPSLDSSQKRANGINYAWENGASVISNSWHASVISPMIDEAIRNSISNGRGGKGTVVVFATGNSSTSSISYPARIAIDGLIAVGASNLNGKRASFSQYGSGIDVVAPGEDVLSTSINSSYAENISGTSFATPLTAATAALVISENSNLTAREVEAILCKTAKKLPSYSFSESKPYGTWDKEVGYGLIDPANASRMAKNGFSDCVVSFKDKTVGTNTFIDGCIINAENFTLKSGAELKFKITDYAQITPPMMIELGSSLYIYF